MKCEKVTFYAMVVAMAVVILPSLYIMSLKRVALSDMDYSNSNYTYNQPTTHSISNIKSHELYTFEHFHLIWNQLLKEMPANITFYNVNITVEVNHLHLLLGNFSMNHHSDINMSGSEALKRGVIKLLKDNYSQYQSSWKQAEQLCTAKTIKTEFDRYICYKLHLQSIHPFHYMFTVMTTSRTIQILVSETQLSQSTGGGSSFKVVLHSLNSGLMLMCSSLDHFNGTYTIECPRIREWYEIIITRVYHDYIAFASDERINYAENVISGNVTVWDEVICDTLAPITWNELPGWREKNGRWW